jgi:TATA-box binding protein (TBP) (component of TFIID and TFIIIB)
LVEDVKVENVVASVTLSMDIPLEKMAVSLVNTE